eukprot:TRINITY_DN668_c0_g1_i1.p5 TRINITY_DN668_c0_g1~~TRINITY_DN668_c0_g1_i1.p5  ORF type:complete len:59 (-),score=7.31 TRINITY_DN668_c0_g1_i1:213-389(-)
MAVFTNVLSVVNRKTLVVNKLHVPQQLLTVLVTHYYIFYINKTLKTKQMYFLNGMHLI